MKRTGNLAMRRERDRLLRRERRGIRPCGCERDVTVFGHSVPHPVSPREVP